MQARHRSPKVGPSSRLLASGRQLTQDSNSMHDSSNATSAAAAAAAAVGVKGQPGQGAPDLLTGMTGRLCHLSAIGSGGRGLGRRGRRWHQSTIAADSIVQIIRRVQSAFIKSILTISLALPCSRRRMQPRDAVRIRSMYRYVNKTQYKDVGHVIRVTAVSSKLRRGGIEGRNHAPSS